MTDYDIANLAYDVERKDVGVPGGMQDQYASTFGGFNLIEFKKEATIVNALRIKRETLNAEWEIKKKLDRAISTEDVEKLLHIARLNGAIGGKLLGAGGGGFLFLYCDSGKQVQVEKAVEGLGAKAFPVRFDEDGLQTWRSPK